MGLVDDVRDWVGSSPDNDAIQLVLDRFSVDDNPAARAALSILRVRRADLDGDRSFAVAGDASWGAVAVENLKALSAKIARLEGIVGDTAPSTLPAMTVTPIRDPEDCRPIHHHR